VHAQAFKTANVVADDVSPIDLVEMVGSEVLIGDLVPENEVECLKNAMPHGDGCSFLSFAPSCASLDHLPEVANVRQPVEMEHLMLGTP
jgi:hypothetical protein